MRSTYLKITFSTVCYFTVIWCWAQKPTVLSFSPSSASYGETVTIQGSNFAPQANLQVRFGAVNAPVIFATESSIQVSVPAAATYAPISVTNLNVGLTAYSSNKFIVSYQGQSFDPARLIAQPPMAGKSGLKQLVVADLDNDGKSDIAYSATASPGITVYRSTSAEGSYTFSPSNINLAAASRGLAAADLNGDGRPELIYTGVEGGGNLLFILKNNSTPGSFSFSAPAFVTTPTNGATRLEVLDLNGDGKPEIVVSDETTAKLYVFINQSVSTNVSFGATPVQLSMPGANLYGLQIQDLNQDSKPDLIAANYLIGKVFYLINESTPGNVLFTEPMAIVNGITGVLEMKVGDFNKDNRPDIALTDNFSNQLVVSLNKSNGTDIQFSAPHKVNLQNTGAWDLALGDIDGDGLLDITVSHQNTSKCTILRNLGFNETPSFQEISIGTSGNSTAIKIGDLNGDSRPDIIYNNIENNNIYILGNTNCPLATIRQKCTEAGIRLSTSKFPFATYAWYRNGTLINNSNSESLAITQTGDYTVALNTSGCVDLSSTFAVNATTGFPGTPALASINSICAGDDMVLLVNNPVSGATYTWYHSNGYSTTTTTNTLTIPAADLSFNGNVWVNISIGDCETTVYSPGPASVVSPTVPTISFSGAGTVCTGDGVTLSIPNSYASYQWKKDGKVLPGKTNNTITVSEAGSYTAVAGITGSCTSESLPFIFQPAALPEPSFTSAAVACLGQAVAFSNTSTYAADQDVRFLWDFGDGTTSTEINPQHTYNGTPGTVYTVNLQIGYGSAFSCPKSFNRSIKLVEAEPVSLEASLTEFCEGEEVSVRVLGDVLAVQWSDGQQGNNIRVREGGNLQANIVTVSGCTVSSSINLQRLPLPELQLATDRPVLNMGESATLSASGGTNYLWSPAESLDDPASSSPVASPKTTTTYTVTSTSSGGCTATAEITIEVSSEFRVNIPKIFVPQADGVWYIPNIEAYPDLNLQIVNSLGQSVLEAKPYLNNWDGNVRGMVLPAGVYYYIFKDQYKKVVRTGSITLLR
ncbi:FG-GAP-like repeat-containing protein [Cesiribacter sp. SM1]|uniref:FG-GAP-like repeat-containing protein n=1 Tax=Cesiribacter sp. SM1 TaxID=2861196 RepID=UPI001CD2B0AF|nr:FG-GAP-like repeat-containing protein [Cesiribacter sp. SM1]